MPRRTRLLATAAAVASLVAACTLTTPPDGGPTAVHDNPPPELPEQPEVLVAEARLPDEPTTVLASDDALAAAVATSTTLFASAPVAVLAPADDVTAQLAAASHAVALGAPLLLSAPVVEGADGEASTSAPSANAAVTEELERLDVTAVLTVGDVDPAAVPADVDATEVPDDVAALEEVLRVDLTETPVAEGQELAAVVALDRSTPVLLTREAAAADPADATDAQEAPEDGAAAGGASANGTSEDAAGEDRDPRDAAGGEPARPHLPVPTPWTPSSVRSETAEGPLPRTEPAPAPEGALLLVSGAPTDLAPAATARAAGWDVAVVPGGDPRTTSATVQAVAAAAPDRTVAVGTVFGTAEDLAWKVRTAATGTELPGGGQVLFPGRRMVALYGTPGTGALGLLGEQDLDASIARAKAFAGEYQVLTDEPVVPAFEIIVTIASAGAGDDGQYSRRLPPESFVPWVEAARDAGVYVVLDLQPGRTDFLTQAKQYEALLRYPNVGLALDPEWRLEPDQVHLRQIGSVGIDEVNTVVTWLADLTREHALPQKLLVLHQFSLRMISERERLDTSRDELSLMIHVDGQGTQPAKQGTWRTLRAGAPDVWWGWKNFVDEDLPMLTPTQTYEQVDPLPQLVTYQ